MKPLGARAALFFMLRFFAFFLLLTHLPESWRRTAASAFQAEAGIAARLAAAPGTVSAGRAVYPGQPEADIEIVLRLAASGGPPRERVILLDSRTLAGMPHAMTLALFLAGPRLRPWKTLLGLAAANLLSLAGAGALVWLALLSPASPHWERFLVTTAWHATTDNLWYSFVGPLIIWASLACLPPSSSRSLQPLGEIPDEIKPD